jgi:dihydroorotate dehydrogenase (fumarate)
MSVDLSTNYLGMRLRNPLVIAASPLTNELTNLQLLEQAGASAAVLSSLFQEQIEHEQLELDRQRGSRFQSYGESLSQFPELEGYNTGPDGYLRHVAAAKRTVSIPIIGSLNGTICGSWTRFARLIQEAGADALELNMYHLAADPTRSAADVEQRYFDLAAAVRAEVSIPLAVKLGTSFSSLPNMVHRLVEAGIDGIVLFNRFAQPDLDLDTMEVRPRLVLSRRDESRLPLRWIAILRDQTPVSLAATGGIHTAEDVLKMLLVGADVTMMASALFQHGPKYLAEVLADLRRLMEQKGLESVERIKGLASHRHCPDPTAFERAHYMKTIASFTEQSADEESLAPINVGARAATSPSGPAEDFTGSPKPKAPR